MGTRVQYRPASATAGGIPAPSYTRAQAASARDSPHKDLAAVPVSSGPPAIIEQSKRDGAGNVYTKRFLKGVILGKGGFAKCYRVTDMESKEEWACKIIEKKSLTKQRHKTKVPPPFQLSLPCPLQLRAPLTQHSPCGAFAGEASRRVGL
jgi:hypothetical protein